MSFRVRSSRGTIPLARFQRRSVALKLPCAFRFYVRLCTSGCGVPAVLSVYRCWHVLMERGVVHEIRITLSSLEPLLALWQKVH